MKKKYLCSGCKKIFLEKEIEYIFYYSNGGWGMGADFYCKECCKTPPQKEKKRGIFDW